MQIKHNLLNKNTTANRVSSRGNPVNLSLQPSLHLCKAPFGDRTNKNSIVNRGSPICVRKRNPADCHHLFVWFCLWDSEFGFIIWFSRGSFGQPCQRKRETERRLQAPFGPSVDSLCHPWFTATNLSYRFPIFETSATALCGTTGTTYLCWFGGWFILVLTTSTMS